MRDRKKLKVSGTWRKIVQTKTWIDILEDNADKFSSSEGLVFCDSKQKFTYYEYKNKVKEIAKGLRALGVKRGSHVGIWMSNRPEWIFTRFAIYKLGTIVVPFNTRYRIEDMRYVLQQSDTEVLIVEKNLVGKIDTLEMLTELIPELKRAGNEVESREFPLLRKVVVVDKGKHPGTFSLDEVVKMGKSIRDEEISVDLSPPDTIHISYTSGTTGFPKGVVTPNTINIAHCAIAAELYDLAPKDRYLNVMPFFGNMGLWNQGMTLLQGATLIVGPSRFDAEEVMRIIEEDKVTHCIFVPTMLLDIVNHPNFGKYDLSSLRRIASAGAILPQVLIRTVKEKLGIYLMNIYGLSEASGLSTWVPYGDTVVHIEKSVGLPMPHCELEILDPKTGAILPPGVEGEICTREAFPGSQHMKGYYKKPELTAETIKDGWLHSGDLGLMNEDGYVYLTGRIKEMFIVGGFNVSPPEIENYILKHPKVAGVAVAGVPDKRLGEVGAVFIKLKKGEKATQDEIIGFCKGNIADIKVPRYVFFVDEFPMNPQGKVQKFKLREKAIEDLGLEGV